MVMVKNARLAAWITPIGMSDFYHVHAQKPCVFNTVECESNRRLCNGNVAQWDWKCSFSHECIRIFICEKASGHGLHPCLGVSV